MAILGSIDIQFTDSSSFTWFRYADDELGSNMSASPIGKQFIGLAYNKKVEEPSMIPSDYLWSRVTGEGIPGPAGEDGTTLYTWMKYADDEQGTNMSNDPTGKKYMGVAYNKTTINESNFASDYSWSLIQGPQGEDAWRIEILSTNGNIFKNGYINTLLYVKVYKGDTDITDSIPIDRFRWTRISSDPYSDNIWNQNHYSGVTTISVTKDDVYQRATFQCQLLDANLT